MAEAEGKTSESSEEEWTYSTSAAKDARKPEAPVASLAERANSEEIKALVENVNWSVSRGKHAERPWMIGSGMRRRSFRQENVDPEVIV